MSVLKGILSESKAHYLDVRKRILSRLSDLPKGSLKERIISGKKYYYLQYRSGQKVVHKYLGKKKPIEIQKGIDERKHLKRELKKVNESLKLLVKA